MSITSCFIEPLDVLFLRGNKLFGDPGSYGESLVPPWPSLAAGAIRSRMLVDDGVCLAAFSQGKHVHPTLGTPTVPGSFTVTAFQLARRHTNGHIEMLMAPPADLVVSESGGQPIIRRLQPTQVAAGIQSSQPLTLLPILAETERSKPGGGYLLGESGWQAYLNGQTPSASCLVSTADLWAIDHRVGVGLDTEQRRVADGRLFSVQAVAMKKREHNDYDIGFVVSVAGATIPQSGLIRLGGDGRGAVLHAITHTPPQTDLAVISQARCCRMVLTSPGIFAEGWRLPGCDSDGYLSLQGVSARLVCAAIPRFDTISGWDLAKRQPKVAQRVAPIGSVYWLDELDASPETLGKLVTAGLWNESCQDGTRRAEGFNRFVFANY